MEFIPAKSIVARTKNTSWFGTEYNMNIYRGCSHGCIYCDSRSSCYHIDDFDTVKGKENALEIIRNDLARKVKTGVVATGAMSDPYNPMEKKELLTRKALELVSAYGFGVAIATKSDLITRDIDVLKEIQAQAPVLCKVSITTASDALSEQIEPRAASSSERFEAIKRMTDNGVFAGVLLMPVLPFIEDTEENIMQILYKAKASGAKFVYPMFGVTLRDNQRVYFYNQLDKLYPGKKYAEKYMRTYQNKYACYSPKSKKLFGVLASFCNEHGILYKMQDIVRAYKMGYMSEQVSFL